MCNANQTLKKSKVKILNLIGIKKLAQECLVFYKL